MKISASVIVPAHNRPEAIALTVDHLLQSGERSGAEVIVIDDGSSPPLALTPRSRLQVIRTKGVERSMARNLGAAGARADLLIFVDDDITVGTHFVDQHLRASQEFGSVMGVGKISLPADFADSAFGRFRRNIESPSQVLPRGQVREDNFCTAANMSMRTEDFLSLGGFDPNILSGEDQDLALRFTRRGGRIVFLPEAEVVHRDSVADIRAYGRRHEWGACAMAPLLRRYPDRPENSIRCALARPVSQTRVPRETLRLVTRLVLSQAVPLRTIHAVAGLIERTGAEDRVLFPLFRILLGLHLFRGYRTGLAQVPEAPPLPEPLVPRAPRA